MPNLTIKCPSGLKGVVRGLKAKDARLFSDKKLARQGRTVDALLKACWVSTEDVAGYPFDTSVDWSKVLIGDRDFTLVNIRIANYGDDYEFDFQCRYCKKVTGWEIDLTKLPIQWLTPESLERFKNGNRFETTLPGDESRKIEFKLATGADSIKATLMQQRQQKQKTRGNDQDVNLLVDNLLMRLLTIDGVGDRAKDQREFVEELDIDVVEDLVARFDEHDCGVETKIEVECQHCDREQDIQIPFDEGFFTKKGKKKKPTKTETSETSATND